MIPQSLQPRKRSGLLKWMAAVCVERTAATLLRGLQNCCIRSKIFRAAFLFNPLMLNIGFKRKG